MRVWPTERPAPATPRIRNATISAPRRAGVSALALGIPTPERDRWMPDGSDGPRGQARGGPRATLHALTRWVSPRAAGDRAAGDRAAGDRVPRSGWARGAIGSPAPLGIWLAPVLDALDEGVLLTDVSGEVVFANAAVRRLCAPAGAELSAERLPAPEVARRLARVLRPVDPREPHAGPRAAFAAASTVLRQVGPPHRVFERTEVVQPAADGGVLGIAAIYRDITDRRTERVRNDRFLTSVAHELRTPLACITGHAGLLDQRLPGLAAGQPDEAAARRAHDSTSRSLRAIRRQVARMDRLLGDVLDTAQLERGTLALQVEEMDVVSLVRTLVDDVAEMAPKHRVDLDLPPVLVARCDATRVEHIIYNLLSNATRFSPAGGVIRVTLATDGGLSASAAPGRFLVLTIGDDGPGIPPEASERIFERYASHDTAVAREVPGLGIRLAISRALAERHGGTLRVLAAGPEHAGGTFELRLPLA